MFTTARLNLNGYRIANYRPHLRHKIGAHLKIKRVSAGVPGGNLLQAVVISRMNVCELNLEDSAVFISYWLEDGFMF